MKKNIIYISFVFLGILFSCGNSSQNNYPGSNPDTPQEEVWEECENCDGKGYFTYTCAKCDGNGIIYSGYQETRNVGCTSCGGLGVVPCKDCANYGYNYCTACSSGQVKCEACDGSGRLVKIFEGEYIFIGCGLCDRKGYHICYSCGGKGKITCRSCFGEGRKLCPVCKGSGGSPVTYSKINDEGECKACNGTGQTKKICNDCEGEGRIKVFR